MPSATLRRDNGVDRTGGPKKFLPFLKKPKSKKTKTGKEGKKKKGKKKKERDVPVRSTPLSRLKCVADGMATHKTGKLMRSLLHAGR